MWSHCPIIFKLSDYNFSLHKGIYYIHWNKVYLVKHIPASQIPGQLTPFLLIFRKNFDTTQLLPIVIPKKNAKLAPIE